MAASTGTNDSNRLSEAEEAADVRAAAAFREDFRLAIVWLFRDEIQRFDRLVEFSRRYLRGARLAGDRSVNLRAAPAEQHAVLFRAVLEFRVNGQRRLVHAGSDRRVDERRRTKALELRQQVV